MPGTTLSPETVTMNKNYFSDSKIIDSLKKYTCKQGIY